MSTTHEATHQRKSRCSVVFGEQAWRKGPASLVGTLLICISSNVASARAEFATVIDSPPVVIEQDVRIESNTQVNIYPGGALPPPYRIGPARGSGENIEINLLGGTIGSEESPFSRLSTSGRWADTSNVTVNLTDGVVWGSVIGESGALVTLENAGVHGDVQVIDGSMAVVTGGEIDGSLVASNGSLVRMSGGFIGAGVWPPPNPVQAYAGSVFLMTGGTVNGLFIVRDSYVNVTGGNVVGGFNVSSSGQLEVAGGSVGPIYVLSGSSATLAGGEFQLNGVPIENLSPFSQDIDFPEGSVLTGVLADGTPVSLANLGGPQDYFEQQQITLRTAPIPESEPRRFDAPGDPVPAGLRAGQSLTLGSGAVAPANFTALPGGSIAIEGGETERGFEATGAAVTMTAGTIGDLSAIYAGTTLQMSGGKLGSNFEVGPGGRLELSGGTVGWQFVAHPDSEVHYSGGKFSGYLSTEVGSTFTIAGGDFKIDGAPMAALATVGDQRQIDLSEHSVLSGTLSNGTPFAFHTDYDRFALGTLNLHVTDVPSEAPPVIRVPSGPAPEGLVADQTLFLSNGGELGDNFTADWGSVVRMSGGGRIGQRFQPVGSLVNVTGGEIGSVNALFGSVVNIDGGLVEHWVTANRGAIVNLFDGDIFGKLEARSGGHVIVSGGHVAGRVHAIDHGSIKISGGVVGQGVSLSNESSLTIEGGQFFEHISAWGESRIEISGGRLADRLTVDIGGQATLYGADFRIDGVPVEEGEYRIIPIDLPEDAVLSGVFSDGIPFAFTSSEGDHFAPGALSVVSTWSYWPPSLRPPGSVGTNFRFPPPLGLRPGEQLTLIAGEEVDANFTAGWESELNIDGAIIGENFEAVGATVNLNEGSIGRQMDALFGTEFNVFGGTVDRGLQAHRGSVVNIDGGAVEDLATLNGSLVSVTGGTVGSYEGGELHPGFIEMEPGSRLEVTGFDFQLFNTGEGAELVNDLQPGETVELEFTSESYFSLLLRARLVDGSPFSAYVTRYYGSIIDSDEPTVITFTELDSGDFDGDHNVDAADLTVWQDQFRENIDGRGLRHGNDFLSWQRSVGAGASTELRAPEPCGWIMFAILTGTALLGGRRVGRRPAHRLVFRSQTDVRINRNGRPC